MLFSAWLIRQTYTSKSFINTTKKLFIRNIYTFILDNVP